MSISPEMQRLRKKYVHGKAELERAKERNISQTIDKAMRLAIDSADNGRPFASFLVSIDIACEVEKILKSKDFKVDVIELPDEGQDIAGKMNLQISGWADTDNV